MNQTTSVVEAMLDPKLFGRFFQGDTWAGWIAILKAADGEPLSPLELAFFHQVAQREPPTAPVREIVVCGGRRAGKDSIAALMATHAAVFFSDRDKLRPGEQALVLCIARDKAQAKTVLSYTKALFQNIPALQRMVTRETRTGLELSSNNIAIEVMTNDHRAVRGRTLLLGIFDEIAHWQTESPTITPDLETYRAVLPSLATLPSAKLIMISTPFGKRGLLYQKYVQHFGKDDPDVLVIKAPSLVLNPSLDARIVEGEIARDPEGSRSEWLGEFRDDVAGFVAREIIESAIDVGVVERPPVAGVYYFGFIDVAGGSGTDSMALCIGHLENSCAVIDCIREIRPPFSPQHSTAEFANVLKSYGLRTGTGDDYSAEWAKDAFRAHNIRYESATMNRSELYLESLSYFNSRRVRLVDNKRMAAQFVDLIRTTSRSGRDFVNHSPGGHDDLANVCAGCVTLVMKPIARTKFVPFSIYDRDL
jgi:hypothetical protein